MYPSDECMLESVADHSAAAACVVKFLARAAVWRIQTCGKAAMATQMPPPPVREVRWRRPPVQQHRPVTSPGFLRWRCAMCNRTAESLATLDRAPCLQIGTGHSLFSAGNVSFCFRCGAYSAVRAHKLTGVCLRDVSDATATVRRQRLRSGLHPLTSLRLGTPQRERLRDEWELYVAALCGEGGPSDAEESIPF